MTELTANANDFSGARLHFFDDIYESGALADFIGTHKIIDRSSLLDFLLFGSILPPRSPLAGVRQLYPGETFAEGNSTLAYLDMSYAVQRMDSTEFVEKFDELLTEYFHEVPNASTVLLSGGIDSAILLSYLPGGAQAITWGGRGEESPDVQYSKITARQYKVSEHHTLLADYDRDFALYRQAVEKLKIPILFNSAVPFLRMAEEGKRLGMAEWLVGQNADTLFMSYPAPVLTNRLSKLNTLFPWNPLGYLPYRKAYGLRTKSHVRLLAYFKSLGIFPGSWLHVPEAYFVEKEILFNHIPAQNAQQKIIVLEELLTESRRNQICQNEIPSLYGITSVCPYYDERFVRLALSIPPHLRRSNGYAKTLLKELARKRGVPEAVITKQKSGLSYGMGAFMAEGRHMALWDVMEKDIDLNSLIDVKSLREREEGNYLAYIMVSSLHYWFEWVARPHGLTLPNSATSL